MMIDDLRKRFSLFWRESEKFFVIVLEKIFHTKWTITPQLLKEISIQNHWLNETFPKVVVRFKIVGDEVAFHVFFMDPDVALTLFALMIDAAPDLELTDEHLEGLKEACSQIWGQVQPLLEDGQKLKLEDLEVLKVNTPQELNLGVKEGTIIKYQLGIDKGKKFAIYQYTWSGVSELVEEGAREGIRAEEGGANVYQVEFQELSGTTPPPREIRNIDMLMDVELEIYVELGRKIVTIRDILKLGKGSIIELDKAAGEPLSVYVNGRKFAEGEVVVVDDQFGIRLTQLVNPRERIKSLG